MIAQRNHIQLIRLAAFVFWLFQKSVNPAEIAESLAQAGEGEAPFTRIRCLGCHWQPRSDDLWYCGDCGHPEYFFEGCGMEWNTFATRGLCPGCLHQWRYTSCLECEAWSPHEDWYAAEDQ